LGGNENNITGGAPNTLKIIGNLATMYRSQGNLEAAENLEKQALETRKRILEEEHPNTLGSMRNLVLIYSSQGKWETAEKLEIQVLETRKRVLGERHRDTLISMGDLTFTIVAKDDTTRRQSRHYIQWSYAKKSSAQNTLPRWTA